MTWKYTRASKPSYLFDETILEDSGHEMFKLAEMLWPLNRSLTGAGNRETLRILESKIPDFRQLEIPSGTQVFDWIVPPEWEIRNGWIIDPDGRKICDFQENNLHVVSYSSAVDTELTLEELLPHIHTLPDQPDAVPYVTSYYQRNWGFCTSERIKTSLRPGKYRAYIDAKHFEGSLTIGEILIPGKEKSEVLLSTYICHPSMANNEISGIVLAQQLAKWIQKIPDRKHTYRVVFVPETIGAIAFISRNLEHLKETVTAGFVLTCVGDDRSYSFIPTRNGQTRADKVARAALESVSPKFKSYRWQDRESDERQYGAPGIDLPVASVMRTKYGAYPEYHTSLDTLGSVVTADGLAGSFRVYMRMIQMLELDCDPLVTTLCEPQLGRRGLYPEIGKKGTYESVRVINEIIGNADGKTSLIEMAQSLGVSFRDVYDSFSVLASAGLVR